MEAVVADIECSLAARDVEPRRLVPMPSWRTGTRLIRRIFTEHEAHHSSSPLGGRRTEGRTDSVHHDRTVVTCKITYSTYTCDVWRTVRRTERWIWAIGHPTPRYTVSYARRCWTVAWYRRRRIWHFGSVIHPVPPSWGHAHPSSVHPDQGRRYSRDREHLRGKRKRSSASDMGRAQGRPGTGSPSHRVPFTRPFGQGPVKFSTRSRGFCPQANRFGCAPSAKRGLAIPRLQHMRDLLHRLRPPRPLRPLRPLHRLHRLRPQPPSDASTSVVTEVRPRPQTTSGRSDGGAAPGLSGVQWTDVDKKDEGQRGSARLRQARLGDSIVPRPPIRG
jgi:hypothetical protein